MAKVTKVDLLLREIKDPYVQENFLKLKQYFSRIEQQVNTTINNTFNTGSAASPGVWVQTNDTISALTTKVVDVVPLADFNCIDYIICVRKPDKTAMTHLKLSGYQDDTGLHDNVYDKRGGLDISVSWVEVGTDAELQITNNEAYGIDVYVTKLIS